MPAEPLDFVAAVLFALALAHTFTAKQFARLAHHFPGHAGLLHLLAEVEVIFGFWAIVLVFTMAFMVGGERALEYAESRNYREPLFVFVVMVIAGSRPVLETVLVVVRKLAKLVPLSPPLTIAWLSLALVPLMGSLITEPAAMTISALVLGPRLFTSEVPERLKYLALGTLFVNISIGGTLSSYAAPPVLMVASTWQWDSLFMLSNFGWKAAAAIAVNATIAIFALRGYVGNAFDAAAATSDSASVPPLMAIAHLIILAGVIVFAHHPVAFVGLFLLFLGFARAYERYQDQLLIKEALLVAFFLAGLVVLGGLQRCGLNP